MDGCGPNIRPMAVCTVIISFVCSAATAAHDAGPGRGSVSPWAGDFAVQPVEQRPALEVRYTDATRTAFEIAAQGYHLVGRLRKPHTLSDAVAGQVWLGLTVTDPRGGEYTTDSFSGHSRINLYRRGPYFCEVHWLDLGLADAKGQALPLKADLALYCQAHKVLGSLTLHATGNWTGRQLRIRGRVEQTFVLEPFSDGQSRSYAFVLFGETPPLPASALTTLSAQADLRYDPVRGLYRIGSHNPGGFQEHFYEYPNGYEPIRFRVQNDAQARTILVCHETTQGAKGSVEGGVLLDTAGHPLPVTVQISKNFPGEKEEPFYNPADAAFSETYFPLVLDTRETCEVTSLHLYQDWGRHRVKQFSSLGAWMDYFHSSTGVTETTCYVPFQYPKALSPSNDNGIAIADFRAMSQATFWSGQPQHDNVAGHSFLSYHDGSTWRRLEYRGTTYRSTGPNWMDIDLESLSSDGKIRARVRTYELPQADELRNFVHVRYEVLSPVTIDRAPEQMRLLRVSSWVQRLRYGTLHITGSDPMALSFASDHYGVRGRILPEGPVYAALTDEAKGSNAVILRSWSAPFGPAVSVWCEQDGDTQLLLVPDRETVTLRPGQIIEFEAMLVPYGDRTGPSPAKIETMAYGQDGPRVTGVKEGRKVLDFPTTIRATNDRAEFTVQGGRDLIPVLVTGLSAYPWPCLSQRRQDRWVPLLHNRTSRADGTQVFCEPDGTFGAVFLVPSDDRPQTLRFELFQGPTGTPRISLSVSPAGSLLAKTPWMDQALDLRLPSVVCTPDACMVDPQRPLPAWTAGEGGFWFERVVDRVTIGARVSANEEDLDLELWFEPSPGKSLIVNASATMSLAGTVLGDATGSRTWVMQEGRWRPLPDLLPKPPLPRGSAAPGSVVFDCRADSVDALAVTSDTGQAVCALVWTQTERIGRDLSADSLSAGPRVPECANGRRVHVRGRLYLMQGSLDDLAARIRREMTASGILRR